MMYIANTYIGNLYTPGEKISDELPPETLDWLRKAGAISRIAPAEVRQAQNAPRTPLNTDGGASDAKENTAEQLRVVDSTPTVNPIADQSVKDTVDVRESVETNETDEADAEDEIDNEAEAPEIDIMDGIVKTGHVEDEKPEQEAKKPVIKNTPGRRKNR